MQGKFNSNEARYLIERLGQKPEGKIVYVTDSSFFEYLGKNKFRATFFAADSIKHHVIPLLKKLEIEKYSRLYLNTSTFNPAAGANSPVDGFVGRGIDSSENPTSVDEAFSSIRGGTGEGAGPSTASSNNLARLLSSSTSSQYKILTRSYFLFDTSTLTSSATISAATFSEYGTALTDQLGGYQVGLTSGTPASNSNLVTGDYAVANFGSTEFATRINGASWNTAGYNDYALNASGLSAISKTGVTKFALRNGWDIDNSAPTWSSAHDSRAGGNYADNGSNEPKLVVTFTLPVGVSINNAFFI